jgi:hypothetical protein
MEVIQKKLIGVSTALLLGGAVGLAYAQAPAKPAAPAVSEEAKKKAAAEAEEAKKKAAAEAAKKEAEALARAQDRAVENYKRNKAGGTMPEKTVAMKEGTKSEGAKPKTQQPAGK